MFPRPGKILLLAGVAALLAGLASAPAGATPDPSVRPNRGFRLFARPLGALTVNRVYCGLDASGQVCVDSLGSSTIGGGYWPKGTANQYVFNSGLQVAGLIGQDGPAEWAGDTSGAFFFDARGDQLHGEQVAPIYNTNDQGDNQFICGVGSFGCDPNTTDPVALAARVASGDALGDLFHPLLQGRTAASQGDVWWLSWEGNPGLRAGREHPLGILVETRGMGWNYPSGNEDIVYFIYTFYNITSINPADYAAVRPGMRDILIQQANAFQQRSEATFGIQIPDGGYTVQGMYANFAADMDVANAGVNYASVNVPFALGYTYDHTFSRFQGWEFDPAIFSAPFFPGTGFVGVKYLKSPEVNGQEVGLTLFSNTTNGGGDLNDPRGVVQLYRYISGTLSPQFGDGACNFDPATDKICYIRNTSAFDMRFYQSSGPLTLGPGEFGSIAVAYIFAAPVQVGGVASCPNCDIKPGTPSIIAGMDNPAQIAAGVNTIDSITGFLGFNDANGDNELTQDEFRVVPGSLLGKSLVAQAVFNAQFLLPFAPSAPDFFLIPGDEQVTVMWRPSASEVSGDPFFEIASQPMVPDPNDPNAMVANVLYDPNYRQFDVEGYRVYRGRVDAPNSLTLLAQYDYAGTVISDFAGQVSPTPLCAPEIGVVIDCPVTFDPVVPGQGRNAHVDIPLVGPIVQVKLGERTELATGEAIVLVADTALTGRAGSCAPSACPELADTGVPFVYVDNTVRNNFRYFYSVTAFDVNSFQSGPTNLESPRVTKPVTPRRAASNHENEAILDAAVYGRDVKQTDVTLPTIDPNTGIFSKKMPASNGWDLALVAFVKQVIAAPGAITVRLDSMVLGSAYDNIANQYWATVMTATDTTVLQIPIVQDQFNSEHDFQYPFTAISIDNALASRFGGSSQFTLSGNLGATLEGNYYTNTFGRGCVNGAPGFAGGAGCDYNGARWFDGPTPANNETLAHPNACSQQNFTTNTVTCFHNAGYLTGVENIYEAKAYQTIQTTWRTVSGVLGGATRGADYNVYWGAGGAIDSVIDVSNNVVVPFDTDFREGASWGILNQGATTAAGSFDGRPGVLTLTDFGCVPPIKTFAAPQGIIPCAAGTTYQLSNTAVPGPIAFMTGTVGNAQTRAPELNAGFAMYLAGHLFQFELTGGQVPAAGTVWSMRDYIGAIRGGGNNCADCQAGADGPYVFTPETRTMAATGAEVRFTFDVINQVNAPTDADLANVHTVPDPYYVTNEFEQSTDTKIIKFVNLPQDAIIRIYSSSGVLVRMLEHHTTTFGGELTWDVRNRNNQVVASGVYFYHVEAGNARRVGRFTIVNFAQ